jgi:carboxypeptidase T
MSAQPSQNPFSGPAHSSTQRPPQRPTKRRRHRLLAPVAIALAVLAVPAAQASVARPSSPAARNTPAAARDSFLLRVTASTPAQVKKLTTGSYDLIEARSGNDYFVVADAATRRRLVKDGFAVKDAGQLESSKVRGDAAAQRRLGAKPGSRGTSKATTVYPTFYGGYRTVVAHEQHLNDVALAHPDLAQIVDYGDSYLKTSTAGVGGHDLRAICLTKAVAGDCALTPTAAKPRLVVMAAIHARELSTSEMAWRWIDYLVDNYNVLPEVTALLDNQEIWVIPVVNPDGRDIVESGGASPFLQRKNADNSAGALCATPPTVSSQIGVDLNRNATFKWGGVGTSPFGCDQTYRGTGAASEPEQLALQTLFSQLFTDTRGPLDTDIASLTTRGALVTLHSYSNLTLLPWGWTTALSPNNAGLRSLAFRMSYYNGYQTGTGPEILYGTTGTTDDDLYGQRGTPGFTIEIGPTSGTCGGFTPPYTCQDSTFWPLIRGSLQSLAKNARQPYIDAAGPVTTSAAASVSGTTLTVTGVTDDNAYGNAPGSFGRPATQNISAAQYYLDVPPWAGGAPLTMTATDGFFNAKAEAVRATTTTTGLTSGRHTVFVRGRDSSGTYGTITAAWFQVP